MRAALCVYLIDGVWALVICVVARLSTLGSPSIGCVAVDLEGHCVWFNVVCIKPKVCRFFVHLHVLRRRRARRARTASGSVSRAAHLKKRDTFYFCTHTHDHYALLMDQCRATMAAAALWAHVVRRCGRT